MEQTGGGRRQALSDNCRKETAARKTRRCDSHDYKSPWIYLITATLREGRPPLANLIVENPIPAAPRANTEPGGNQDFSRDIRNYSLEPTELGLAVEKEITGIPALHPEMRIYSHVLMPDHIHFVLHVTEPLRRELGKELAGFFGACSKHWKRLSGNSELKPLFQTFHDRLLFRRGQLDAMNRYVLDNPRRLFIRKIYPDLFRRFNHLRIDGTDFAAYGNIFLLRNFNRLQVIVHRADTPEKRAVNNRLWTDCAAAGGVLVSPFISPDEKAVRDLAVAAGGSLIILRNNGFPERFKPNEREFNLCAEGRLLLLAPWPDRLNEKTVSRKDALAMNELARKLCQLPADAPMSLI